jgi:hypothetical protein
MNLDKLAFILNDYVYNKDKSNECYQLESIDLSKIEMNDIIEPEDYDYTDELRTNVKYEKSINGEMIFKRYGDNKINTDIKIGKLDKRDIESKELINMKAMYILGECLLRNGIRNIVLPIKNFTFDTSTLKEINPEMYEFVKDELGEGLMYCNITEHFYKMMSVREYLDDVDNITIETISSILIQLIYVIYVLSKEFKIFRHNNLTIDTVMLYLKEKSKKQYKLNKSNEIISFNDEGIEVKITYYHDVYIENIINNNNLTESYKKENYEHDIHTFTESLKTYKLPESINKIIDKIIFEKSDDKKFTLISLLKNNFFDRIILNKMNSNSYSSAKNNSESIKDYKQKNDSISYSEDTISLDHNDNQPTGFAKFSKNTIEGSRHMNSYNSDSDNSVRYKNYNEEFGITTDNDVSDSEEKKDDDTSDDDTPKAQTVDLDDEDVSSEEESPDEESLDEESSQSGGEFDDDEDENDDEDEDDERYIVNYDENDNKERPKVLKNANESRNINKTFNNKDEDSEDKILNEVLKAPSEYSRKSNKRNDSESSFDARIKDALMESENSQSGGKSTDKLKGKRGKSTDKSKGKRGKLKGKRGKSTDELKRMMDMDIEIQDEIESLLDKEGHNKALKQLKLPDGEVPPEINNVLPKIMNGRVVSSFDNGFNPMMMGSAGMMNPMMGNMGQGMMNPMMGNMGQGMMNPMMGAMGQGMNSQYGTLAENYYGAQDQLFNAQGMNADIINPYNLNVLNNGIDVNQVIGQPAPQSVGFMPGMMGMPYGQQQPYGFNPQSMGSYSHLGSAGSELMNMPQFGGGSEKKDFLPIRLNYSDKKKN